MKLIVLFAIFGFVQICSSSKSVDTICDTLKARPNVDGKTVDDLCNLFKELKRLNEKRDAEWKVVYSTLMTIALNGDRSKTNWTVSGIRQNFSGRTQQTALIDETNGVEKTSSDFTEKQFLDELETMLSKALDSSKTTEALAFAKKIYRNIGRDKDVYYAMLILENVFGLSEGEICNILTSNPNECIEDES